MKKLWLAAAFLSLVMVSCQTSSSGGDRTRRPASGPQPANAGRQTWARTYARQGTLTFAGDGVIYGFRMCPAADGGLFLLGHTAAGIPATYDSCVMKVSPEGLLEWQQTFREGQGAGYTQFMRSIRPTADGGVIGGGESSGGLVAMKFLANGDVEWQKLFDNEGNRLSFADLQQTGDGGYLLLGSTGDPGTTGIPDERDILLIKLDSSGNPVWQKTYDGLLNEQACSFLKETDGGILICGCAQGAGSGSTRNLLLLRLSSSGEVEWQASYGGFDFDVRSFALTNDGGSILSGRTYQGEILEFGDAWAMKIAGGGGVEWAKVYHGSYSEHFGSIQQTPDGGFIASGQRVAPIRGLLVKLAADGELEWQRMYGGNELPEAFVASTNSSTVICADGGAYYVWGDINCVRSLPGGIRGLLMKTSTEGEVERLPAFLETATLEVQVFSPQPLPFVAAIQDSVVTAQDAQVSRLDVTIRSGLLFSPPVEFSARHFLMTRSLALADYTNELSWQPNPANDDLDIVKYRIYCEGPFLEPFSILPEGSEKVEEVDGESLRYYHRLLKPGEGYFYLIWGVTTDGGEGIPTYITKYTAAGGVRP